jgi:myo-inositol catabolism protein IolC
MSDEEAVADMAGRFERLVAAWQRASRRVREA